MPRIREILLVYDKECPACNFYCQLARIRESVCDLLLVNARDPGPVMDRISEAGLDIDQGMVLVMGEEFYYGSDAIHMLSMLSTRTGVFNRIAYHAFRSRRVAHIVYPFLRALRNLLLKILRKSKINNLGLEGREKF